MNPFASGLPQLQNMPTFTPQGHLVGDQTMQTPTPHHIPTVRAFFINPSEDAVQLPMPTVVATAVPMGPPAAEAYAAARVTTASEEGKSPLRPLPSPGPRIARQRLRPVSTKWWASLPPLPAHTRETRAHPTCPRTHTSGRMLPA